MWHELLRLAHRLTSAQRMEMVKLLGAIIAFGLGLWQYHRTQVWKRVEFVAKEMSTFFDDEAAKAAMTMLDWSKKTMELYRYRNPSDSTQVLVTYELVKGSLGTSLEKHHSKSETAVREIFDRFLSFLERFESFIETGAVHEKDLKPYLHYWTKLLSGTDKKSPKLKELLLPQLWVFIHHFGYDKVARLVSRYDKIDSQLHSQPAKWTLNRIRPRHH
jgi:hypothetical protein